MMNKRNWVVAAVAGVLVPVSIWAAAVDPTLSSPSAAINCESNGGCNISIGSAANDLFGGTTAFDSLKLKNDLTVDDDTTVTGDLTVSGTATITGALTQTGALTLGSTLAVPNGATTLSSLSVTGTSALTGAVTAYTSVSSPAVSATSTLTIASGSALDFWKHTSSTIDADSIPPGQSTTSAVTVTGAAVGDSVLVTLRGSWASPSSSVVVLGNVQSADTVTLTFGNTTNTAVDLTSAVYGIDVFSHSSQ